MGSELKLKRCLELGAIDGSVRTAGDFWDRLESFTSPFGYDIILDPVGGHYLGEKSFALKSKGKAYHNRSYERE